LGGDGALGQLAHQPGFSNPTLARDQQQPAVTRSRPPHSRGESSQLSDAIQKWCRVERAGDPVVGSV
jgi:hypothetical protein